MTQPLYMFRAGDQGKDQIIRVKVISLTDKTLTYSYAGYAGAIHTATKSLFSYRTGTFPTWSDAHTWLLARAKGEEESLRREFQHAQSRAANIQHMSQPEYEDD